MAKKKNEEIPIEEEGPGSPGDEKPSRAHLSPARWLAIALSATGLALLAGCLLWPSVVWDQFVYRYFWGSTVADAVGHPVDGITEDYNLISTIVYGMLLAAAVYFIYVGFRQRGIRIDLGYILALVPFVLFGTLARSLEDSFYYSLPMAYIFISPQIYVLEGVLVVGLTLASRRLGRLGSCVLLWAMVPLYILFFVCGYRGATVSEPTVLSTVTLLLLTAVLSYSFLRRRGERTDTSTFLAHFGVQSVAAPMFLVAYWCAYPGTWGPLSETGWNLLPAELAIITALAIAATFLFWLLFALASRRNARLRPLASGTSTLIFFGHFLDASTTYRALDFHGYGEKHVLSNFLIEKAGTAAVMFPLKAVSIGMVLYVLEVEFRRELDRDRLLRGLLRAAILILGLAPGLRDMLRLVMGV